MDFEGCNSFFVGSAPGNSMTIDTSTGLLTVPKGVTCCTELTVSYGSPTPLNLNLLADGANQFVFKFGQIDPTAAYIIPSFTLTDSQNHQAQPLRNAILPA